MPQTDMAVVRFEGATDKAEGVDKASAEVEVIGKGKEAAIRIEPMDKGVAVQQILQH